MLDSREHQHDRNYRERKIGCHHPKHDCKISEQQPFHRRAYGPKARQPVVDDTLPAEHEAPGKGANQPAREERDGEERDEQCRPPWSAQETDRRRSRNSEERASCRRQRGLASRAEKHRRSSVLQKLPIGCERPDGLDPVGIEIEAPETPCRDEGERDKSDTDENHEGWKREEEG